MNPETQAELDPFAPLHRHVAAPPEIASLPEPMKTHVEAVLVALREGTLNHVVAVELISEAPLDAIREATHKTSGMNESLLVTMARQISLIDNVVKNMVTSTGQLRPGIEDQGIKLKDALDLSLRMTQTMMRDLPKLYEMDRLQKLEEALGGVMEEMLTEEQRKAVLDRLREIAE